MTSDEGTPQTITPAAAMLRIDGLLAHVWVVRTFLKHAEEAEEDDRLMGVVRELYDACLAVGPAWTRQDAAEYLHVVRKKIGKLRSATEEFARLQPEVSAHTNYAMAVTSLRRAVEDIGSVLEAVGR